MGREMQVVARGDRMVQWGRDAAVFYNLLLLHMYFSGRKSSTCFSSGEWSVLHT